MANFILWEGMGPAADDCYIGALGKWTEDRDELVAGRSYDLLVGMF